MKKDKFLRALLFPHVSVLILLIPLSAILLILSFTVFKKEEFICYSSYAVSAYTLCVICMRTPKAFRKLRLLLQNNKYLSAWQKSARLRINVSLYSALVGNTAYGIFYIILSIYQRTFWFYSLGAYYLCLAAMRIFLVHHTRKFAPKENIRRELLKYRATGYIFLVMNMAISLMLFFMVYFDRSFEHGMIGAIAIAAYTFISLTVAIVNSVKYKRYKSPLFSAAKIISLASASVSMLMLEATMLSVFAEGTMDTQAQRGLLFSTGSAICVFIVTLAIYMIIRSTKQLKALKTLKSEVNNGKQ